MVKNIKIKMEASQQCLNDLNSIISSCLVHNASDICGYDSHGNRLINTSCTTHHEVCLFILYLFVCLFIYLFVCLLSCFHPSIVIIFIKSITFILETKYFYIFYIISYHSLWSKVKYGRSMFLSHGIY